MDLVRHDTMMPGYERKLLIGMLVVMLAFLPTLGFAMYCLKAISRTENQLNSTYTKTLIMAEDLRTAKVQQDAMMPAFVLSGDPAILDGLSRSDRAFDQTLSNLEAMPLASAAQSTLATIRGLQQELIAAQGPGIAMKKAGVATSDVHDYFRRTARPLIKPILEDLDQFVQETSDAYDKEKLRANRNLRIVFQTLVAASSISVIVSVGVTVLLVRLIRRKKDYDVLNARLADREREISIARKEALETVAHDLKNPLSAVMMAAGMLQNLSDLSATDKSRVGMIAASADSMNRLIGNLLDHTKIESGALTLAREACDIGAVLTRLIARFEILATLKTIRIVDRTEAVHTPVFVDEARIEQVFSNLLGNAVKFTGRGGTITITDSIEADRLVVAIRDTGPGMTEEQASHVFERYWQAGETASSGTGLGLAISKAIVDAHDGDITVSSEPGVGSIFQVSLPLAARAEASAA